MAPYKIGVLDKHIHNQPYKIRTCVCPINIIKPNNTTKLGHPCDMKNCIYSKLTSYKIGANQNGLIMVIFLNKIWCPKSIFWVPLYSNYSIVLLEYVILYSSFYKNISISFYIHHYLSYRFFMICSQLSILNQFWFYRGHSCLCIKDSNFKVGPIHPIPFHPQEMLRVVAIKFDFIGLIFLHASQIPIL